MQLTLREIASEALDKAFAAPDPFAHAVFRLYHCPPAVLAEAPRVVVLTRSRDWKQLDATRRLVSTDLESAEAAQLLWSLLRAGGQRLGEVVYDRWPEVGDHVFHRCAEGYRVTLSLQPSRVQPVPRATVA